MIGKILLSSTHRFIYIHGKSGLNKSSFVLKLLQQQRAEYSHHRLHEILDEDDLHKILISRNVMNAFMNLKNKNKTRYVVIDDIDVLSNKDKKTISLFITFIKKTKDQNIKLIFIGTNNNDKRVKELMKLCHTFEVKINLLGNSISGKKHFDIMKNINQNMTQMFTLNYSQDQIYMSDRSTFAMVFHENVPDFLHGKHVNGKHQLEMYRKILQNICEGDIYDRYSFQKQLWKMSDMSFIMKVQLNYQLYKEHSKSFKIRHKKDDVSQFRFTKILTKYSNEYSNLNFMNDICQTNQIKKYELFDMLVNSSPSLNLKEGESKRVMKIMDI